LAKRKSEPPPSRAEILSDIQAALTWEKLAPPPLIADQKGPVYYTVKAWADRHELEIPTARRQLDEACEKGEGGQAPILQKREYRIHKQPQKQMVYWPVGVAAPDAK
jgi:hypothetical protein